MFERLMMAVNPGGVERRSLKRGDLFRANEAKAAKRYVLPWKRLNAARVARESTINGFWRPGGPARDAAEESNRAGRLRELTENL